MFVESIRFKRTERSEWEKGYYIGETDNSRKSVILDKNYVPITDYSHENEEDNKYVWDYHTDTDKWIQFRCEE